MHLLHRSSKRLFVKRHIGSFARLVLHPLRSPWHLGGDPARNYSINGLAGYRIHYQGCPLAQHMLEALRHKSDCRRQPLEHSASEVAGEASSSTLVREAAHFASTHADNLVTKGTLNPDNKESGSYEDALLDLAVAEAGTTSTKTYKWRKQHVTDGSTLLKSSHFSKPSLQNIKKDIHTLPEEILKVDSRVRSLSMDERRQINDDGAFEGDAKEISLKHTGESTENEVLKPALNNVENLEMALRREDTEAGMSQAALKLFVKENTSMSDGKNKEEKYSKLFSFHRGGMALKVTASSTKKLGCVPRPSARQYLLEREKKNKRKRKKKKTWDADRQLGPDDLKYLSLAAQPNQIAASATASCIEKPRMHGRPRLPNYSMIMSGIVTPVVHTESSGQVDSVDTNVLKIESKSNCSEQKVSKQVDCVERAEDEVVSQDLGLEEKLTRKKITEPLKEFLCDKDSSKWKELSKDLGATGEVFSIQRSYVDMEPKMHKESDSLGSIGKGKGTWNKNGGSSLYQNRENLIVYDDFKVDCRASTSSDACFKGSMGAQLETLEMGLDGDQSHHAGASKVHYPLRDLNLKDYYVILDLNGVLIKRWGVNPSLPVVSKLNRRWIQLRPGCIEFLCKAFSKFKVGIWSTMTHKNVMGVCKLLEQQAHQPLPFFMLWSKDSCYQQKGVRRPDKPHVLADFKPLSHVWHLFEPYLGFHNTVLIDDSPYKACMNNPYNCIFPDAYEGCTDDNYLNDVLWPYLEKMRMSQNIQAYIANNPLGQQPIVVGHKLYYHVQGVMDFFAYHIHLTGKDNLIGRV